MCGYLAVGFCLGLASVVADNLLRGSYFLFVCNIILYSACYDQSYGFLLISIQSFSKCVKKIQPIIISTCAKLKIRMIHLPWRSSYIKHLFDSSLKKVIVSYFQIVENTELFFFTFH